MLLYTRVKNYTTQNNCGVDDLFFLAWRKTVGSMSADDRRKVEGYVSLYKMYGKVPGYVGRYLKTI